MSTYAGCDYVGGAPDVSDTDVGHWFVPLVFGASAGGLGGYYFRKWQEEQVRAPSVGGPWVDIVGAQAASAQQQARAVTRTLIQSAIDEVREADSAYPSAAYVWTLDPPAPPGRSAAGWAIEHEPTSSILSFPSYEEALQYVRTWGPYLARAVFDRRSPHWPNPVSWSRSSEPGHEPLLARRAAKFAPVRAAGEPWQSIVGTEPWQSIVGTEPWQSIVGNDRQVLARAMLTVLRKQAKVAAEEMPGRAIGVLRDPDDKWTIKAFRSLDDADDWFGRVTSEPRSFTYAAYFDKSSHGVPFLENETIGGGRARGVARPGITREIATVTVRP